MRLRGLLALIAVACLGAAAAASAHANQPTRAKHTRFVASYDVVLTGGLDRTHHRESGDVTSDSHDAYQGRGILSLQEEANGKLVPATNSFAYQSATWDLSGTNGSYGGFSCSPPVETTDGTVDAHGWVLGGVMYIRFSLAGTREHNDDYDCGAHFTGYATDSSYEAQSLQDLEDAQPGGLLVTNADHPSLGTLTTSLDEGSGSKDAKHTDISWTFTITKRSGSANDDGGPSPSKSRGPVCTINGTKRNDVLVGTSHDDVICAYGGNDRIDGRAGRDLVFAGSGKDVIKARDKMLDRVDGGPGRDQGTFDKQPRDRVASVERAAFG